MDVISREFVENEKLINVMTALENGNLSRTGRQWQTITAGTSFAT
jgi:hypothetical protein